MFDQLRKKIENRLTDIRRLRLDVRNNDDFYYHHMLGDLRIGAAFVLDFYLQQLQHLVINSAIESNELQHLQNEVRDYRKKLNIRNAPNLKPMVYLKIALQVDDLRPNGDFELFDIALQVSTPDELNQVNDAGSILTRIVRNGWRTDDVIRKLPFLKRLLADEKLSRMAINAEERYSENALMYLCNWDENKIKEAPSLVKQLLSLGAAIMGINARKGLKGKTAFIEAAKCGNYQIIQILLQYPGVTTADLAVQDSNYSYYYTALDHGINRQHQNIVEALLEAGAPIENSSLELACEKGSLAIVKLLMNAPNRQETVSLGKLLRNYVCQAGHKEVAEYLLNLGVDVDFHFDFEDNDFTTPLSEALYFGHTELARYLISRGANKALAQKILGWSNFTMAAILGDCYGLLQAYRNGERIDVNTKGWGGYWPKGLSKACRSTANDIIYLLHILPGNQLPEIDPKWSKYWLHASAKTPEGKKAYAIITLKKVLSFYHTQRRIEIPETHYGILSFLFGGFSKQEKLGAVDKLLRLLEGVPEELTPKELRILEQGRLGKCLKYWEEVNKTRLQDTLLWFKGNILEPGLPPYENRQTVASPN